MPNFPKANTIGPNSLERTVTAVIEPQAAAVRLVDFAGDGCGKGGDGHMWSLRLMRAASVCAVI